MKKPIILFIVCLIAGCAQNPFAQFYYDQTGGVDIATLDTVILPDPNAKPALYKGSTPEEDRIRMLENGYTMIGYSSFNGGNVDENGVFLQAKKVHASAIILYSEYTNTVSGAIPLTTPDNKTSMTNASGNIYGSGGQATFNGTATTTTYGTKTTYIPYNVRRYDYGATYWLKIKPPSFGAYIVDMDAAMRAELQSNQGVLVDAVMKSSPAYKADIFRGDIVKSIDNTDVYTAKDFQQAVSLRAGKIVNVIIFRAGKIIEKEIHLNSPR